MIKPSISAFKEKKPSFVSEWKELFAFSNF